MKTSMFAPLRRALRFAGACALALTLTGCDDASPAEIFELQLGDLSTQEAALVYELVDAAQLDPTATEVIISVESCPESAPEPEPEAAPEDEPVSIYDIPGGPNPGDCAWCGSLEGTYVCLHFECLGVAPNSTYSAYPSASHDPGCGEG